MTMQMCFSTKLLVLSLLGALPVIAQVNPNACKQIREDDLATLVTLNQSTVEARDQTRANQCVWDVKTPLSFNGGEVTLTLKHFESHAEAVAYMKNELPFYFDKKPPLVKTTGPDDHVDDLLNRPDWAQAEAVHGEYMSKVEVSQIEPGARAHPSFEYRLQRLALQAAGATILPTAGLPPDPVRPKAPVADAHKSSSGDSHSFVSSPAFLVFLLVDAAVIFVLLRRFFRTRR